MARPRSCRSRCGATLDRGDPEPGHSRQSTGGDKRANHRASRESLAVHHVRVAEAVVDEVESPAEYVFELVVAHELPAPVDEEDAVEAQAVIHPDGLVSERQHARVEEPADGAAVNVHEAASPGAVKNSRTRPDPGLPRTWFMMLGSASSERVGTRSVWRLSSAA
jgi:hypothetical protein